jgi:DNA mismatch endonuclease (patch repair protein)
MAGCTLRTLPDHPDARFIREQVSRYGIPVGKRVTKIVREETRRSMRSNRSRDTSPEVTLRKALWQEGLRGYRLHRRELPGTPDIVFIKRRVAVLVHGCYWHACRKCGRYRLPATNRDYWLAKIARNRSRDARNILALRKLGYRVVLVWECQLKQNLPQEVARVRAALGSSRGPDRLKQAD